MQCCQTVFWNINNTIHLNINTYYLLKLKLSSIFFVKENQSAFRKFHLGLGMDLIVWIWYPTSMTTGLCWLFGKSPKTLLWVGREAPFLSVDIKHKSGLYTLFHLAEWKVPFNYF